jgi:hypothetical protein
VDTPVPNLRHHEWVAKLVVEPLHKRNRFRTFKWALTLLMGAAAAAFFRVAFELSAARLGWTAPPGRSGEVTAVDRQPSRPSR